MNSAGPRAGVAALIPAYLEERHLRGVVERVRRYVPHVLVVDDGSADATSAEAALGGAEVLRHAVNQGKGAAIKSGLRLLAGRPEVEMALLLDGDGQHLPEEIPAFLAAAERTAAPLLCGNRMADLRTMPLVRRWTNQFMSGQISRVLGQPVPDSQCGFRLVRRCLFAALEAAQTQNYDFETEMLAIACRDGGRIGAVPVTTVYGDETSKIRPVRDTVRFFRLLQRLRATRATRAG